MKRLRGVKAVTSERAVQGSNLITSAEMLFKQLGTALVLA